MYFMKDTMVGELDLADRLGFLLLFTCNSTAAYRERSSNAKINKTFAVICNISMPMRDMRAVT